MAKTSYAEHTTARVKTAALNNRHPHAPYVSMLFVTLLTLVALCFSILFSGLLSSTYAQASGTEKTLNLPSPEEELKQGMTHYWGLQGTERDYEKAFQKFMSAALAGHPTAMAMVADMLYSGVSTITRDEKTALDFAMQAADKGNLMGYFILAKFKYHGIGGPASWNDASRIFSAIAPQLTQAEARDKDPIARYMAGWYLYRMSGASLDKNHTNAQALQKAAKFLLGASKAQYVEAQYTLGSLLLEHPTLLKPGAPDNGYKIAATWLKRASEQGHAPAQAALATMYQLGLHYPKSSAQAFKLAKSSAEQGYTPAAGLLGTLYMNGLGTKKDDTKAREWLHQAAESGIDVAMVQLAQLYMEGRGGTPNPAEATYWLKKAARIGNMQAAQLLGQ